MESQWSPINNNRSKSALNRNHNCCLNCKRHHQKCVGYPCQRCMTHGWECVLNPDRPASTMAVPSASAPGSSSQNALGASAPIPYQYPSIQPQQPQQQYTIQHGSLVIPGLGPIVYVMPRSPSSQHGVSSGYTVYHVQSVNGVDHVLATQCDDNYRPISQSVLCGTKADFDRRMRELNQNLSVTH